MTMCPFAVPHLVGYDGGSFIGVPWRVVWHTTEGSTIEKAQEEFRTTNAAHFLADGKEIRQLISTDRAAKALRHPGPPETNRANAIQIELVCFAGKAKPHDVLVNARKLAVWLHDTYKIPWVWPNGSCMPPVNGKDGNKHNRNAKVWIKSGGHYGHEHTPNNIHWDPAFTSAEQAFVTAA